MAAITSQNVAQAIVKLVAADALPGLLGNLRMGNLVNRQYEPVLANAGDTVNVPIPPILTANNIAESGSVQTQNPSLGNAQLTLSYHRESTFQIPDVTAAIASPDLRQVYLGSAVRAIAEQIETDILSITPNFTALASVGAFNTPLIEGTVDLAEQRLFDAKVPASEERYLALTSTAYSQLRQLGRFSELQTIGSGDSIVTGDLMRIKGMVGFRTQYLTPVGSNTTNLAFTRNAIGLVTRKLPQVGPGMGAIQEFVDLGGFGMRVTMSYQPNTLSQQFTVDVLYGIAVFRNNFGVQVLS